MARGPRKHLKRLAAPKSWMLSKTGGIFATNPNCGPHRKRESIPLALLLKKLNLAATRKEEDYILSKKMIKVNGRVRSERKYPVGLFDVLTIQPTNTSYRLLYNITKRFYLHKIDEKEANVRLCKVRSKKVVNGVPYVFTEDGMCYRFLSPNIDKKDTLKIDVNSNKVIDSIKFSSGKLAMVTRGNNMGCVGVIVKIETHEIGTDLVYLKDKVGRNFATRGSNVFVVGTTKDTWISLPHGLGVKTSEYEKSVAQFGAIVEEKPKEEEKVPIAPVG
ncbi:hypothetical protein EDEG_02120 [Edhazardia aedis USNM 41457]|uniref:40S ribosomal protein S4 n=1 Tax=Edhazardia aedis (strain USNM 41457) TaxID=1003232 RepID=J9D6Y7_EDHAE|nr:hypothetical protein EDEG_02120 [Edhazardia aedis USNM 41457]|eukprot:EJW03536.1 hypothetical protein EDEG_02120 [Edhazardia aedis USNM 41457]